MPRLFEGGVSAEGKKFAIIVSQFNQMVTKRLLDGAVNCFQQHGSDIEKDIDVFYCPGAFEIPEVAAKITERGMYDAVVCLGAIVRGETPHFEYVASEAARGIGEVARRHDLPVAFGVLTTDTVEQALARAGGERGNKGYEAAVTALEMVALLRVVQKY